MLDSNKLAQVTDLRHAMGDHSLSPLKNRHLLFTMYQRFFNKYQEIGLGCTRPE